MKTKKAVFFSTVCVFTSVFLAGAFFWDKNAAAQGIRMEQDAALEYAPQTLKKSEPPEAAEEGAGEPAKKTQAELLEESPKTATASGDVKTGLQTETALPAAIAETPDYGQAANETAEAGLFTDMAEAEKPAESPGRNTSRQARAFRTDVLWRASWVKDEDLTNRVDLRFYTPGGFSLRAEGFDKRDSVFWEDIEGGKNNFGFAAYQNKFNSRIVFGQMNRFGLASRTSGIWGRSVPFAESHQKSGADLKTSFTAKKNPSLFFQLGSPSIFPVSVFASVFSNPDLDEKPDGVDATPASRWLKDADFSGGASFNFNKTSALNLEGYYKKQKLPEKKTASWFSREPWLPEREFLFYAASAFFYTPFLILAGDAAFSKSFAWGKDIYANAALSLYIKSWTFSIAADGAGSRYMGKDGTTEGKGFRAASKIEWQGENGSSFKASSALSAAFWNEPFTKSSSQVNYRPPSFKNSALTISSVSIAFKRDGESRLQITDGYEAALSFHAGPFTPAIKYGFQGAAQEEAGGLIIPYPVPDSYYRDVSKTLSLETALSYSIFYAKISAVRKETEKKEAEWRTAFYCSLKIKGGYLNIKLDEKEDGGQSCSIGAGFKFSI
ncbi:MAG: hypothetical protein LBC53_07695 [Spirochaetaceae bacterium]|jgi:hypothetical protein|nr:hypothetical protein [Spirochaetaceae bacterium]